MSSHVIGAHSRPTCIAFALLSIGLCATCRSATAAPAATQQVVVTATRGPQPVELTGESVSVISSGQIQSMQLLLIPQALALAPGVSVAREGGAGQSTSVYLRGAGPGQTLVLIDGVRLNDPTSTDDEAIFGDLLVNDVRRIEILEGPQSTLYGSDAIGGVIDILTRIGGPTPWTVRTEAQGGSYGTWRFNAAANGSAGALDYGIAVNDYSTAGVSAADSLRGNREPDGYREIGALSRLRVRAGDGLTVDLSGYYTRSHTDIDGYPPPLYRLADTPEFGENRLLAGYGGLTAMLFGGRLQQRLAVTGSDGERNFYGVFDPVTYAFSPAQNFLARGSSTRVEYQGIARIGRANELTYGAETELDTLFDLELDQTTNRLATTPTRGQDRISGYYAQWQSTLVAPLTVTAGVRYDHDQEFGGHTSVKLAAAWHPIAAGPTLRCAYGDGFKAPSLYELYSEYSDPLRPLQPERAVGWEVGADQRAFAGRLLASATWFERSQRDQIGFDGCYPADSPGCASRPLGFYYNVGRTSVQGLEAAVTGRLSATLTARINYTLLDARDELTGAQLALRPRITANAGLQWQPLARLALGASFRYIGARFSDAANRIPLSPRHLLELYGQLRLPGRWQLIGRVENLLDDRNEPVYGYGTPGRALYAGVRATL